MHLRRVQECRQFRHGGPEALGILLDPDDRHVEALCRLDQQAAAPHAGVGVVDRGCEPRLAVDQKQKRSACFEEHKATIRVSEDAGQPGQRWFAVVKLPGSAGDY